MRMDKKVIDIEERIPQLKQKRKRKKNTKFIVLLLILLLLLSAFLYFQSSFSKIKRITINGAELLSKEAYLDLLTFQEGDSMWRLPVDRAIQNIEKSNMVKKVTIKRKWPQQVNVTVKEWKHVAYVRQDTIYKGVLESGRIYQSKYDLPIDAPIISGFTKRAEREAVAQQLVKLPSEVTLLISQIENNSTKKSPNRVHLYMNDGFEVYASMDTFAKKMKYYPEFVSQIPVGEKGTIDLEVGSYYRPFKEQYDAEKSSEEQQLMDGEEISQENQGDAPETQGTEEEVEADETTE